MKHDCCILPKKWSTTMLKKPEKYQMLRLFVIFQISSQTWVLKDFLKMFHHYYLYHYTCIHCASDN